MTAPNSTSLLEGGDHYSHMPFRGRRIPHPAKKKEGTESCGGILSRMKKEGRERRC